MPKFKSASELFEQSYEYVRALLIALSDCKMLLGFHYGEWTFGTPALEASIAACSMSQDEFGHLRLLHSCLASQFKEQTQELIEKRPTEQFSNAPSLDHPLTQWADFVAVNLLTDGAITVLLKALQNSSFEPVANFIDKMIEEEKHHVRNSQGWFRTLATNSAETKSEIERSSQKVLRETLEWLGPQSHDMMSILEQDEIINCRWGEIENQFLNWIGALAEKQGLAIGLKKNNGDWKLRDAIDYSQWNPTTRRCTDSKPDDRLLYHLKGSKNEIFKLA